MGERQGWVFLSNHALVLLCISKEPDIRVRDIARRVDLSERATLRILNDLCEAGYVTIERVGRRNHYTIDTSRRMRHPLWQDSHIGELLEVLAVADAGREPTEPAGSRRG